MKDPRTTTASFVLKSTGAIIIGLPFMTVGLFLCLTVIGIPVGLPLMVLGSLPFAYVQRQRSKQLVAWEFRPRPMDNMEEKPWMM
jgi:uncharacterized membrane protein YccF (DUF307 family)